MTQGTGLLRRDPYIKVHDGETGNAGQGQNIRIFDGFLVVAILTVPDSGGKKAVGLLAVDVSRTGTETWASSSLTVQILSMPPGTGRNVPDLSLPRKPNRGKRHRV